MAPLRVGLIGAGSIAPPHIAGWHAVGATVTVYSRRGADDLARRCGATAAATRADLLDSVDIVGILTPTATHRDDALAAIAAGKHVVCEKPLAASAAEALEIAQAAAAAGVHLYPAHVVRYFPEYAAAHAAVRAGRIGAPAILRLRREGQAPSSDWFFDESVGGGIVRDQMIHDLDQARWIFGEVTEVYAVQSPASVRGISPRIVTAQVVLTHASGALSHVQGVWGAAGLTFRTSIDVAGSEGTLHYAAPDDGAVTLDMPSAASDAGYLPPITHAMSPYEAEIREFAAAFAGGPAPRVSAADGIVAVGLVDAAMTSIATGAAVPFDETSLRGGEVAA